MDEMSLSRYCPHVGSVTRYQNTQSGSRRIPHYGKNFFPALNFSIIYSFVELRLLEPTSKHARTHTHIHADTHLHALTRTHSLFLLIFIFTLSLSFSTLIQAPHKRAYSSSGIYNLSHFLPSPSTFISSGSV